MRQKEMLCRITEYHPHAGMLKRAAAGLLVCGDPALQKHEGYWVQDCSAATQNILIAAEAAGLGAVWVGIYPRRERVDGVRQLLAIPEAIVPFSIIALGYPAEEKPAARRYDPSRAHRESWGQPWE